jgi:hypothetical protein
MLTGNRNAESPESLEAAIRDDSTHSSLPVVTIADPGRIYTDRRYAELVVERLLEVLMDLDELRGTHRFHPPPLAGSVSGSLSYILAPIGVRRVGPGILLHSFARALS